MTWTVMPAYDDYEAARVDFEWDLPASYNPAVDFVRKHDPDRIALRQWVPKGDPATYTFGDLDARSDALARAFESLGVETGDRVGVVVPQKPENPLTHLANWKVGAVSVPLTVLFGPDALEYRLRDSGAVAVVVDPAVRGAVEAVRGSCPALDHVVEVGSGAGGDSPDTVPADATGPEDASAPDSDRDAADGSDAADPADYGHAHAFDDLAAANERDDPYDPHESTPDTHTAIMYTSGSTGPPKGVLHGHALWLGRAAAAYNYFDQGLEDATLWTPADWAWGAALGGTLFAAWHHGCTVVGYSREGFDPETAFRLMADCGVTHAFMPPTALRLLMDVDDPAGRYDLALETVAAAGESITPEILTWAEETFEGVAVNEFYGQTELNLVVGNCSRWFETRPGSMGKPLPGYDLAILDPETRERLPRGEVGEIALSPADESVFFDEYWGLPEQTAAKRTDDGWYLTGDLASRDPDGYVRFKSRADDVIITSGYRVGPTEVEEAVLDHPAVQQAGVVGVPDETRGEVIKAFVRPVDSYLDATDPATNADPDANADLDRLREEIRNLVRERLAEYEYPREIEFVAELPQTTTGKIRRADLREREEAG